MAIELDQIDKKLLTHLQADARLSYNALAKLVKLSAPSVAERVRRMEDVGLIEGYHVAINRQLLGWDITAFIRLSCPGDRYQTVHRLALEVPEILECHHITGEDSFILKITASDMGHLEQVITRFRGFGQSISSVVMSTDVEAKPTPLDRVRLNK